MRLALNTGRKNSTKNRHLGTIAQFVGLCLRTKVLTIGKKFLNSNMCYVSSQCGELRPTNG